MDTDMGSILQSNLRQRADVCAVRFVCHCDYEECRVLTEAWMPYGVHLMLWPGTWSRPSERTPPSGPQPSAWHGTPLRSGCPTSCPRSQTAPAHLPRPGLTRVDSMYALPSQHITQITHMYPHNVCKNLSSLIFIQAQQDLVTYNFTSN